MNHRESYLESLTQRVAHLERVICSIALAPTESERSARLEVAHAEIQNRQPSEWAKEYIEYVSTREDHYF